MAEIAYIPLGSGVDPSEAGVTVEPWDQVRGVHNQIEDEIAGKDFKEWLFTYAPLAFTEALVNAILDDSVIGPRILDRRARRP